MRVVVAACLLLGACQRDPLSAPVTATSNAAPPPSMARAEAFERGAGVARDYRAAAAIYTDLCDEGAGDPAACRRLLDAILDGRGVDHDRARVIELGIALCKAHGDLVGCTLQLFVEAKTGKPDPALIEKVTAARTCDADHLDACEAGLDFGGGFGDQSGSREWAEREFNDAGCGVGVIAACVRLVIEVSVCDADHDEADEPDEVDGCVADQEQAWSGEGYEDRRAALARVRAACDAGDAAACAALPGRAIPLAALCAAHDYGACAELGCEGDEDAALQAAAHGVDARC